MGFEFTLHRLYGAYDTESLKLIFYYINIFYFFFVYWIINVF